GIPSRSPRQCGSEENATVGARAPHSNLFVEAPRRAVLRAHEEAHRRRVIEEESAQVAKTARTVALVPRLRVNPHLLELDGAWRPGRRLGLEEDRPALDPEPCATLLALRARP